VFADSGLCQADAVLIHDGRNAAEPVLEKICGRNREVIVTGTKNVTFIIFSSDTTENTHKGFTASFEEGKYRRMKPDLHVQNGRRGFLESRLFQSIKAILKRFQKVPTGCK